MRGKQYSPVIRSLHRVSQGDYDQAFGELSEVWRRALRAGEKTWAAVVLWHCMIIAENMGDWSRAVEYGEQVLLLQDDAYLRLFLFRAYRHLEDDQKASEHLRAGVDLADDTRDQAFLEILVNAATHDEEVPKAAIRRREPAARDRPRWDTAPLASRRWPPNVMSRRGRNIRMRDA